MKLSGVRIGTETTMTVKHRRIDYAGKVYFIATFPEGDLSIHEWSKNNQNGYGGSLVTFLLEDGAFETVKGPFECNDAFDFGRREILKNVFGIISEPTAVKICVGKNLCNYISRDKKEIIYEDKNFSCEPIKERIKTLFNNGISDDLEWALIYRGCIRYFRPGT